jgi:hypothetical protein
MKNVAKYLLWIGILTALALPAFAETRTISWNPVTAYTDGTSIETGKTVGYTVYWATDSGLGSLRAIGASLAATSTTFDPDVQGMTRGGTVYFTAKAVLNTGEESVLSPAYAWVVPLATTPPTPPPATPPPVPPPATPPPTPPPSAVLTSITVSGTSSVSEGGTGTYTATGRWDNGTTSAISPTWSVSTSYASISAVGLLTATTVTSNQTATVTASYGGRTGTMSVTIVDVPGKSPAVPKNIGITGPISSGATVVWRLAWDPVTTYANGAPLEAGRTVRYATYWTDDPALSAASLRQLASSASAATVDFDPVARVMPANRPVYLTVQSVLDNGDPSSLAASIEWVVANTGPAPPAGGIIKKK